MSLQSEIQDNLNRGYTHKAMKITCLPDEYPAWTVKQDTWIGVVVPMPEYVEFSEEFANARIFSTRDVHITDQRMDALILACYDIKFRNPFATICAQFVDPGEEGKIREKLITDPETWWLEWKNLLGNKSSNRETYPIIGELLVLEKLLEKGEEARWGGPEGAVHDVECHDRSYEVKSTIQRYGYVVSISSAYQMDAGNRPLYLAFCRFEESDAGRSLNDVVNRIVELGYSEDIVENELRKKGFEKGRTARKKRYRLLEMRVYPVNQSFPSITPASFVDGVIPANVASLSYDIDLNGLECRSEL